MEPLKLCECGCGRPTKPAPQSHTAKGWVKGEPMRFLRGHSRMTKTRQPPQPRYGPEHPQWRGDDAGYSALHKWLWRNYPKTGVCVMCGQTRRTQWSFLHNSERYTRNIADYRELCVPCHTRFDLNR